MNLLSCVTTEKTPPESVKLHPVFNQYYGCAEHHKGQFQGVGDALGTDCYIIKSRKIDGRSWFRRFKNNGHKNEDWFGWRQPVLSPIAGKIVRINENKVTNEPGILGKGMSTFLIIQGENRLHAMIAHLRELEVKVGDVVERGQIVGKVGNNGQSWFPHIHIGAWIGKEPKQIRFDQSKIIN